MSIKRDTVELKEKDIYSLILFAMFKLKDVPEYSSVSELAYVLDQDNLLKLCEVFGGQTISIPTIDDMQEMVYALLMYQYVDIQHMDYTDAIESLQRKKCDFRKIKSAYLTLKKVLDNYDIKN